jgi:light-regulated signal transduction histidine kinase (bacteriophytochrome)
MHKVIRHDLPNQMVALQSLLHLLNADESSRLSDDGREYVRRLQSATQGASDMVRFLKQMQQLNTFMPRMELIALNTLARELQGELQRHHPDQRFEFEWSWAEPSVRGDSRVLLQALLQLYAGLATAHENVCRIRAGSARRGDAIELAFELDERTSGVDDGSAPTFKRWNQHALDQCPEIVLAREWLALANAVVDVSLPAGGFATFRISVNS